MATKKITSSMGYLSGQGGGGGTINYMLSPNTNTKKTSAGTATAVNDGGGSALMAYMQALEARQQQAANDAYNRNVEATNKAFAERSNLMKNNLDSTLQNLETDYNASKANVNKDAQNSLQQAYINNMMNRKNLNQNMAAQGLSGGASETTMAGMYNNYGNARNNIETVANDNLGNLENLYNKNRNSAYQAYNDQLAQDAITKAQYMAQFESDRQNALANAYNTQMAQLADLDPAYAASMSGLESNQRSYDYDRTAANNATPKVNTETQNTGGESSGIMGSYYGKLAKNLRNSGRSDSQIAQELANEGVANSTILYIINQLQ